MTVYRPAIDPDAISALDVTCTSSRDDAGCLSLSQDLMDASAAYFRSSDNRVPTVEDLAARYRAAGMAAVVFTIDAATATGHPALSSEDIAARCAEHADVLIPFGSVDPHRGAAAVEQAPPAGAGVGGARVQVPPQPAGLQPRRHALLPAVGGAAVPRGAGPVPHRPERHRRGPARGGPASSCATPSPCCSTTSPRTSRT